MRDRNAFKVKGFVIVFSLLVVFALPGVSLATSFSDIQPGHVDNTLKMGLYSRGSVGSDDCNDNNQSRGQQGKRGEQPQVAPIPAAAWLFGTGLIGLYGIRRKLQK
jgi:hypothetical protein